MISAKTGATITVQGQYLKDLSFENPQAPSIYTRRDLNPGISVSVDINATKLQTDTFEVELQIVCNAKVENETMFNIELLYGGIFKITNVEENLLQENLFIDCPAIIFPFARRIIADCTRDANYPPLMLDAIDFEEMYNDRKDNIATK